MTRRGVWIPALGRETHARLGSHETRRSYHPSHWKLSGPVAMFTRPDTGATPISYPVPTYSAAKGMFEAVLGEPSIYIRPTRVEICKPIRYERYITNYGGPLRKL